jgi:hypothetical protein
MTERTIFQILETERTIFQILEDGQRIFLEMRAKYPNNTNNDFDNILNGLCASLICLIKVAVDKDNHRVIVEIIHKILTKNLDK